MPTDEGAKLPEIALPQHPKETEFEEFVSAFLQCGGAFVERQIHEKEGTDVLELDVVLSYYEADAVKSGIVEVKSGGWGCGDLFKLAGWMKYLSVDDGVLAALGANKDEELLRLVADKLGIGLAWIADHAEAEVALVPFVGTDQIDPDDVDVWRYSYWLERCLEKRLNDLRKCGDGRAAPGRTYEVHKGLQSNLFARDMLTRTAALYQSFQDNPHLSARWGAEAVGMDFDGDHVAIPDTVFADVYYSNVSEPNDLDVATWVEQRTRLALFKNLVDYELMRREKGDGFEHITFTFLGMEIKLVDTLPASFQNALEALREEPYFHRYPVLWQWFLWVGGGFLLLDRLDEEYAWLGAKSGIPAAEVPKALAAYEQLFPTANGWFKNLEPNSRLKVLALMPVPYCGIGAFYRKTLYGGEAGDWDAIALTGPYTRNDLIKWNNNAYNYLARSLGLDKA